YNNIADGIVVYPKIIRKRILEELPFMATENILMEAVKRGGDRQVLHERIRVHSMEASKMVKEEGKPNDLIKRIADDPLFDISLEELDKVLAPENYIGRSKEQVEEFLSQHVLPVLKKNKAQEVNVELTA
ncbi:MAG: adenylosuccinate lyase, partial [Clostridiaceae bacterium]|nr:adenylosuccinate lyase [Clostridiaceae bacterium]